MKEAGGALAVFSLFFRPTRIGRNLSVVTTCEHADSTSSPTCLQSIGEAKS
jgi:hypothetical protein